MRRIASCAKRCLSQRAMAPADSFLADNPSAVLMRPRDLQLKDMPLAATPPHGHVRIAMKAVGICGSDLHYFNHGRIGNFIASQPIVLGHEGAGQVVQVGGGVTAFSMGDRVALEPGVPCWQSRLAREGRYNLDEGLVFAATPPHHGMLASYFDHPAEWCYRLPDNVSDEQGALCEPLSVGIHACRRAQISLGAKVAILGAGPIGLVTMAAARAFGAMRIVCTDLKPVNLHMAAKWANKTLQVDRMDSPLQTAQRLHQALGCKPDVVIDACGFQSSMQTALLSCASGGRVVLVGMGQSAMQLELSDIITREVDIIGSFRYCNTYSLALELMASGRIDVQSLVTHRFGWSAEELASGFKSASQPDAVKVMFKGLSD